MNGCWILREGIKGYKCRRGSFFGSSGELKYLRKVQKAKVEKECQRCMKRLRINQRGLS